MREALSVTLLALAAGILALAGIAILRRAARPREATQEPPSPAATARGVLLRLVRQVVQREPAHVGATERWSPAAEVGQAAPSREPAPDWDTGEWALDVHRELNRLEDDFRHDVEHLWSGWYDRLGIDARTRMRLASSVEDTGQIDRAELDAMLAEVGA
ncbi:MAG TPA: hypothetical protein VL652_34855 [Kutzneria sp.]|jgi:hypothetical protein|nr:hypothetical protein [Kutzneria sp.]